MLCSQEHPSPQYCLYYGQDVGQNSLKTILPDDLPKSDENITKKFRRLYNIRLKNFTWQIGVIKIAIGREFDTVIFEGNAYILSTWIASVLARLRGKRVLFWSHGFLQNEKGLKGWIRTQFYKLANALVLYGNRARNICLQKGFRPNSLYVVFNSLDLDTQVRIRESISDQDRESIKKQLFTLPDMPLLLWVGRLTESKRLDLLLQAARYLIDRGRPVNVLVVGDGPAKDSLETLSRNLGLEQHIRFHGACYDEEELGILIGSADLCVGPGEIGLSCIHALTYGTPVVTHGSFDHQGPEVEAVISGRTGDFFRRGDSEDLTQVILNWLNRQQSQEAVISACHEQIDRYYNPEYQLRVFNAAVSGVPAKNTLPTMSRTTNEAETSRCKPAA